MSPKQLLLMAVVALVAVAIVSRIPKVKNIVLAP